jgi:hypothetical protein
MMAGPAADCVISKLPKKKSGGKGDMNDLQSAAREIIGIDSNDCFQQASILVSRERAVILALAKRLIVTRRMTGLEASAFIRPRILGRYVAGLDF